MSQCETTQVREYGTGAALLGYSKMYGQVPGGQAEYLRVPQAHFGPIKVPDGPPDEQFLFLSDVLPTAWQGVEYADVPEGGTLAVFGLGPIGQMTSRVARHRGARVIGIDMVPERLAMAERHGVETLDLTEIEDVAAELGLEPGGSLRELAQHAPAPWDDLLHAHRDAFVQLTTEISQLADGNRELLAMSHRATQETLMSLQETVQPYDPQAHTTAEADRSAQLLDQSF